MADCFVRLGFLDTGDDPAPMIKIMRRDLRAGAGRPASTIRATTCRSSAAWRSRRSASSTACSRPRATASSLTRALIGLDSYLKQLGTVANWHRIFKECVERYGE